MTDAELIARFATLPKLRTKTCATCGTAFSCGPDMGTRPGLCWCADLPPALPVPTGATTDCLCPTCLTTKIKSLTP